MFYISTESFILKGYYEELVDDGCPAFGTYTRDVNVRVPAGTGIELLEDGSVKSIDIEFDYGVSMYGSTLTITEKVLPLHEGKIKPISNEEYLEIKEHEEKLSDAYKHLVSLDWQYESMVVDMEKSSRTEHILTEKEYRKMSEQLWHNTSQFVKQIAVLASLRLQKNFKKQYQGNI